MKDKRSSTDLGGDRLGLEIHDGRRFVAVDLENSNCIPKKLAILNRIIREALLK
jgi:hypothetical protein